MTMMILVIIYTVPAAYTSLKRVLGGLRSEGEYNQNSKNTLEQAIAMLNKIGFAFTGF